MTVKQREKLVAKAEQSLGKTLRRLYCRLTDAEYLGVVSGVMLRELQQMAKDQERTERERIGAK